MHHRDQLALGLFPEDSPPPYPNHPTAIVVSVSGGLDSDYAALWARQKWPSAPIILWHAYLVQMDWDATLNHLRIWMTTLPNAYDSPWKEALERYLADFLQAVAVYFRELREGRASRRSRWRMRPAAPSAPSSGSSAMKGPSRWPRWIAL